MAKGNYKTGHVWFDAEDMRQARKVAAYWRRWLLLPHTKVHIRRGHRVVVNLYTYLEALWFMSYREECIRYYQHRGKDTQTPMA